MVAAGHPPGGEAAEGAAADLADRLVAAEVDEGRVAAVRRTASDAADPELGGDVAGGDRALRARRAGRSAGRAPPRGSGAAAQSPIAQTESIPCTRRWSSTGTRPRSSSGTLRSRRLGLRGDAGGPDHGPGRQRLAGREPGRVGADLLERRAEADVDAAAAQLAQRVLGELGVDLRQDPVGGLDQDPAHPVQAGPRVALDRVGGEVLELGERLEAGVAAADEDVGEQLVAAGGVVGRVRGLERLDHVVAQPDRVGQRLEADRVVGPGPGPAAPARPSRAPAAAGRREAARPRLPGCAAGPCGRRDRGRRSRRGAGRCGRGSRAAA